MARGVPVACSDASALAEVAGEAALLFDPLAPAQIGAALERLLTDPVLRASLAERGRARAARYSWEATARATLAVYETAIAQ